MLKTITVPRFAFRFQENTYDEMTFTSYFYLSNFKVDAYDIVTKSIQKKRFNFLKNTHTQNTRTVLQNAGSHVIQLKVKQKETIYSITV